MPAEQFKQIWLLGARYKEILQNGIESLSMHVIWLPDNPNLSEPVRGHADLSAMKTPDGKILLAPYLSNTNIPKQLKSINCKFEFADIYQNPEYPEDVQLCVCQIGNNLIYNPKTADENIIIADFKKCNRIACKQGYTRCSIFVIDECTAITSDNGINDALIKNRINVLKIHPGYIRLAGYEYGFIGGSGFMLDQSNAVFSGTLDLLPDKDMILKFFAERKITVRYLTPYPLFDFGGAVRIDYK